MQLHFAILSASLLWDGVPRPARFAPTPIACDTSDVRTSPAAPRAGTLFRVSMAWTDATTTPAASLAGEPLHWRRAGDSLTALAAVPIDSSDGVSLQFTCSPSQPRTLRVATVPGAYRLESLRVAPTFSATPDSALAARMRDEAARAAAISRASHAVPRLWTQPFIAPRASRITSGFGNGRTFNGTVTSRHMGTDYAGAAGAPVRAANRGVVRLVDAFHLGGNVVYLDHGEGIVTAYLHLKRQRVTVGDTVSRGQIIGDVGATGRVTGAHLHFIARYGSITVDPAALLRISRTDGG